MPMHHPHLIPMLVQKKKIVIQVILVTVKPMKSRYTTLIEEMIKVMIEDGALLQNLNPEVTTGYPSRKTHFNTNLISTQNHPDHLITSIKDQMCAVNRIMVTHKLLLANPCNNAKHVEHLVISSIMNAGHSLNIS